MLDFVGDSDGSREIINDWVSDQTEERIKDLIPQGAIDAMTRLVLANAIYFKADWLVRFEESGTEDAPFTLLDGSQVGVPMMSQVDPFAYAGGPGYQAIELVYYGEEISMVVFLPDESNFDAFEDTLNPELLQSILDDLEMTSLSMRMPKFEFESEFSLVKALKEMGMPSAFTEEANFSAMDGTRNLVISDVVHKAFVSVDEAGTEAAAAVIIAEMSAEVPDVEMHLDRPFIFGIRDIETGTLLFLGRVMDPES